ncbi:MAG: sulfur carrier protein ThiS [Candidatus Margulisbacteria bacterium]|nr:sulfur carrier protein ThiS [Candidatus Margulisiibacteriota bacterium]
MMTLTLNGQFKMFDFEAPVSVEMLLVQLSVNGRHVVIEKGGVIYKCPFEGVMLSDGDVLEIVHFVGGGLSQHYLGEKV